ncbi:DNA polymerase III subunit alpha [Companilactobacillus allii]|uniref:DNA polymerase III subunit alpha n=1 Tax=Companilactobacillus allii TaxID=1847728 RepID=A0A1P8Q4Z8_9LACO|nr:DNA polymerase III subunit alpha [Companilactobacillus allii]APX72933.1 DNA polymerase III subunit alpha [Companilactobacillus allii]USQ67722.1 DNA polymerase III subunit alpha [Companilactobacillus allii]
MQTQLQVMSSFSLLHSPVKLPELVDEASKRGYSSIALTDIDNLYGSIDFYKYAKKSGVKPIIGMVANLLGIQDEVNTYSLILLAKNDAGYHNLIKISSQIMSSHDSINIDSIKQFMSDIFVITPADQSEILVSDNTGDYFRKLKDVTDPNSIFLGVGLYSEQIDNVKQIKEISNSTDIPMSALGDVRYINEDDHLSYQVLNNLRTGEKFENINQVIENGDHYLRKADVFETDFANFDMQSAVATSNQIADQCNVEIEFKETQLPKFESPNNLTSESFLRDLATRGLNKRLDGKVTSDYVKRLNYELSVIEEMGFSDYFLIVWDVIKHAHEVGIRTGPGRGSAAGSLVSYTLGITQVDPIKYDLLFERFLNPQRVNMPDIDLDLPDDRRDEMVMYMHDKYGSTHMAQIITFGTLAAKMALRDISRTFSQTSFQLTQWSNAIPRKLNITLEESINESNTLKDLVESSQENQLIFKVARRVEGIPRHYSTHAAGIVLSKKPMTDIVAVQLEDDGINLTQQTKNNVESVGLLKMDFLGLRNLTILDKAIKLISKKYKKEFVPERIPLNDQKTLELFQRGDTDGVFQFESDGIKSVLRQLKPTSFNDVVATNALYRPGPMQNISTFIARKHGSEPVTYPDSSLEKILEPTYGILVYQEQVMQASSKMAGFSLADADILRRAISKKNELLMDENRKKFVEGAVKLGHDRDAAEKVYKYIETFGNYGFNKSHSVAYSMVAFWLAYIKVHFPQIFFICLMNANLNSEKKITTYIQAAKDKFIPIKNVNINQSNATFKMDDDGIRFGFLSVKGMRRDLAENIIQERQKNGEYTSVLNFLQRIDIRFVKDDYLDPLILSGVFDSFNRNRRELMLDFKDLIESMQLAGDNLSLFDVLDPKKNVVDDYSLTEKLNQEKKFLGVYVSGHPVEKYRERLLNINTVKISNLKDFKKSNVSILGLIKRPRVIRTKKGQKMCFATVEDETGSISVTIFPKLFQKLENVELEGKIFLIVGRADDGMRGDLEFIADKFNDPKQYTVKLPKNKLYLRVSFAFDNEDNLSKLYKLIESSPGKIPVILYRERTKQAVILKSNRWINFSDEIGQKLEDLLGKKNVFLKNSD